MALIFNVIKTDVEYMTLEQIAKTYTPKSWEELFEEARPELEHVSRIIHSMGNFFPYKENVFKAFELCRLPDLKVVIVGQDPYPSEDNGRPQANGLSFSTDRDHPIQPSLRNIYKELSDEYSMEKTKAYADNISRKQEEFILANPGAIRLTPEQIWQLASEANPVFTAPNHGDLREWAVQGVLMLNACLTVLPRQKTSHKGIWNGFLAKTVEVIKAANPQCIFLLMGGKAGMITEMLGQKCIKIVTSHPSPLSATRGMKDSPAFLGSNCFRDINKQLLLQRRTPIDWRLTA